MAKFKEKIKAHQLRRKGKSIKEIAKILSVSKSTVSIWCRNIELTKKQIDKLQERMVDGNYNGGLKGARTQHERRVKQIEQLQKEGLLMVSNFSDRDLLFAGAGLYWGEGTKNRETRFINSNPEIIKFIIHWLRVIWGVGEERLKFQILINSIHKNRISEVEKYWCNLLAIKKEQFTKTILIKRKNRKVYKNFKQHYGTIVVRVLRGGDLLHNIKGVIAGMLVN